MFAASKKLRIAVLDAKGKALGMEIEKVKTKNKKGENCFRYALVLSATEASVLMFCSTVWVL